MITGAQSARDNLGGPIAIAVISETIAEGGIFALMDLIAQLSVFLAMVNLLPIPVLDGGHLAFYGYEAIRGKPASKNAMRIGQNIGFSLLIILMLFVFGNDILRFFF